MSTSKAIKKNVFFLTYYAVLVGFMTLPGLFDLGNRIEPRILGFPFAIVYLLICVGLLLLGLFFQYKIEEKTGELDIMVEPIEDKETTSL